ncbi:hypothetical protein ABE612_09015 [Achromobacter xylosoxidans]|uniref:hypothetical protein n=1 Tax=Alcaligenes xylosoxydans xylosoxydans TaxID=85698 RepID=UPI003207A396
MPFLVQVCSEYVVKILQEIAARLLLDRRGYGTVLEENPAFLNLAQQCMTSYWDCYYRRRYPTRESYVGFCLFEQLRSWRVAGKGLARLNGST